MMQTDKKDTILVTGGTGFVGQSVVRRLLQSGRQARLLARKMPLRQPENTSVEFRHGNVLEPQSLEMAMQGCAGVIHLVGIIRETRHQSFVQAHVQATENVLQAARAAGVGRYIHMSALGARENAPAEYHKTKWRAEQLVQASSLNWTIFRPGLIHGPQGEFTTMVVQWHAGKAPPFFFMPYFGGGLLGQQAVTRVQPVLVDDVAELFVRALETTKSEHQTYELGGPDQMTWPQMLEVFNTALPGPRRAIFGIPFWLATALSMFPLPGLPFNRDQVMMAGEDSVCDLSAITRDFPGFVPRKLETSVREYIKSMGVI